MFVGSYLFINRCDKMHNAMHLVANVIRVPVFEIGLKYIYIYIYIYISRVQKIIPTMFFAIRVSHNL